jgi:hypothetical protein
VEVYLLLILGIIGLPMIVLVPPGAGYDEEDHLVRVWELSAGSFIPAQMSPQELSYPTVFRDFAYRQQGSAGVIDSEFWQSFRRAALDERGFVRREIDTKSVYSPALLLPQAFAMGLFGRVADLPALSVFYLCRLAGLLSYLTLAGLAVRLIPFGKWILLVLALSPMALFQATTISPDAISNGIGFLFIAGCLWRTSDSQITWREVGGLILLIFLLFLAKLNLLPLILLPFLLIPPSRFESRKLYLALVGITAVLFLIEVAGWYLIASRSFNSLLLEQADPRGQVLYILSYPLSFLTITLKDFLTNGWLYLQGWINGYGYYYWTPPWIVSLLFLLGLGCALLLDASSDIRSRRLRTVLLLVFVAGCIVTVASIYISYAPVGADQVSGVQGRYFIPLALPLLLALASLLPKRNFRFASPAWSVGFLLSALSINLLGLYLSFHIECGSTYYQTGLCYGPLFKDFPSEARASEPVSDAYFLAQEFQVACNGLTEVRVLLTPSTKADQGITRFIIQDSSSGQVLLDQSIANAPIQAETWYPLRFEPDWLSAGKQYTLEILGTSPIPGQGLQFFHTPQPEFDLGISYVNGELIEEDIVLQYGCIAGLRKIWLLGRP